MKKKKKKFVKCKTIGIIGIILSGISPMSLSKIEEIFTGLTFWLLVGKLVVAAHRGKHLSDI